jgi:hypothetical protein
MNNYFAGRVTFLNQHGKDLAKSSGMLQRIASDLSRGGNVRT